MYTVYGDMHSGNCYKVKLLMQVLADGRFLWESNTILHYLAMAPENA